MSVDRIPGRRMPEEKLYQLVVTGLNCNRIEENSYRRHILQLVKKGIGGFFVYGGVREDTKDFIASLQDRAATTLFIASDIERGIGQTIRGAVTFPCRMAFAAAINHDNPDDCRLFTRCLRAIASEAIDCGINLPLMPALDGSLNPDNPPAYSRSFSDSTGSGARFGYYYMRAFEEEGLPICGMYLTGHKDASVDSHDGLAAADALIVGVPEVVEEHNMPASCIEEGADVLLFMEGPDAIVALLYLALRTGELSAARIEEALKRIGNAKAKIAAVREVDVDYALYEALADEVTERSITLVKGHGQFMPVREPDGIPLIFAGDEQYFRTSTLRYYVRQASHISKPLPVRDRPTMFLIFTHVQARCETSGLPHDEKEKVKQLMKGVSQSIVVSFGSPYALDDFREADILVAAYDTSCAAQDAVFKCISGESPFRGHLPVTLNP